MNKLTRNKKFWYLTITLLILFLLAGCATIYDENHQILPEKIISLTSTFADVRQEAGWFEAIFVWPMAQLINYSAPAIGVAGAIALVTIAINVLTFGLTVNATVSSQKMQIIQPELQKIQDKYRDRKDQPSQMQMANEMQAVYSKHKINPLGALIVPFLQLPILLAMYQAVQRAEAVVYGDFMGVALTNTPKWGLDNGKYVLLVIFVLMAIAQFASMKLPQYLAKKRQANKKKSQKAEPTAASQNGMMYGMLALIVFWGFTWPTAMSLYWMITSLVTIIKTYFIQWRYIDNEKV